MTFTGPDATSQAGFYRVALLAYPGIERDRPAYHWLRQNPDGTWSGKNSTTRATDRDFGGHLIHDPAKADFAYYHFIGYFFVPEGGLDVGSPDEPISHPASKPAYRPS